MVFKCKMCGGEIDAQGDEKVLTCPYCSCRQSLPNFDDEKKASRLEKADSCRLAHDFQKAISLYEILESDYPNDPEAYWGSLLCKYGIEYVDDPSSGKKVITCHHLVYQSILDEPDYAKAIELADVIMKDVYEEEAHKIDALQRQMMQESSKEKYDVFICYKESDQTGGRTEDSVLAQSIYEELLSKGYKAFFARITLEGKAGAQYEPIIYSALCSSKVLLHVTTSLENTNSVWVKNEWGRFCKSMGQGRSIIPCYRGISPSDLPSELRYYQGIDFGKIGAMQDLMHGLSKIIKPASEETKKEVKEVKEVIEITPSTRREYQEKSKALLEINDFCASAKDVFDLIEFFDTYSSFRDCASLAERAKIEFIKRADTKDECAQAERYIAELKSPSDRAMMEEVLEGKKSKKREQQLLNEGVFINVKGLTGDVNGLAFAARVLKRSQEKALSLSLSEDEKARAEKDQSDTLSLLARSTERAIESSDSLEQLRKLESALDAIRELDGMLPLLLSARKKIVQLSSEQREREKKRRKKKRIIILSIALGSLAVLGGAIGGITAGVLSHQHDHSPAAISISFVGKRQEYKSRVSGYTNGCYYVYFDLDISSSSSVGVQYLQFKTYVTLDGSNLGYINSSIESMNLGANSSGRYSIYLQDNQPEKNNNTFFISLYNASYGDLSFSSTISSIWFTDGKWYNA